MGLQMNVEYAKSKTGTCYKQRGYANVTFQRRPEFYICCLSVQSFSSSKHFKLFLQVSTVHQPWVVIIIQCVRHTHTHRETSRLLPLPFMLPVKKPDRIAIPMCSFSWPCCSMLWEVNRCYCTLKMPESQIICAPDDTGKDRVCLRGVISGLLPTDEKQVRSTVEAVCRGFLEVILCIPLGSSVSQRWKKSLSTLGRYL